MGLRKIFLLAGTALAAVALAFPATGSGAQWTHEGKALGKHVEIGMTGPLFFSTVFGAYTCDVHATVTTEGGESGTVTKLNITEELCVGSALFEGCKAEAREATNLPWIVQVSTKDLIFNGVGYDLKFDKECPIEEVEVHYPQLTAEPDKAGAISLLKLSGEGIATMAGLEVEAETNLSYLEIEKAAAGTYGIG